jgi:hypothetical protein
MCSGPLLSSNSVEESAVEVDALLRESSLCGLRIANLPESVPDVVRPGFVLGAEMPGLGVPTAPTATGEREAMVMSYGTDRSVRSWPDTDGCLRRLFLKPNKVVMMQADEFAKIPVANNQKNKDAWQEGPGTSPAVLCTWTRGNGDCTRQVLC